MFYNSMVLKSSEMKDLHLFTFIYAHRIMSISWLLLSNYFLKTIMEYAKKPLSVA